MSKVASDNIHKESTTYKWIIWLAIVAFYAYQYILRVLPNIAKSDIMNQFDLSAGQFGDYAGIYYLSYVGAHIPFGLLLDRYSIRYIIPFGVLLCVMGVLPMMWPHCPYYLIIIGRLLIGAGSAASVLGAFKIIRDNFLQRQFNLIFSITVTIGLLTVQNVGVIAHNIINSYGLVKFSLLLAIIGLFVALLIYLCATLGRHKLQQHITQETVVGDIKQVVSSYKLIAVSLLAGCMLGPLEGFADAWGGSFLHVVYGINEASAVRISLLIFTGFAVGLPVVSYIADKTRLYYTIIVFCGLIMLLAFWFILIELCTPFIMHGLMLLIGFMSAYQILTLYKASTYVDSRQVGTATAIINMIVMSFGTIFHKAIGYVYDITHDGKMLPNGTPEYSVSSHISAISVIPAGLIIGIIGFIIIGIGEMRIKR